MHCSKYLATQSQPRVLPIIEPFPFYSQWMQSLCILLRAVANILGEHFFSFKGAFHFAATVIV